MICKMKNIHIKLFSLSICSLLSIFSNAQNIYVSTTGDDSAQGSINAPFRTIQKAADIVQAGDTVWIFSGTYRETVNVPTDGTAEQAIVFKAFPGDSVTISGGKILSGWLDIGNGIWKAPMQSSLPEYRNQLFINGKSMTKARWPNIIDEDPLTPEGGICDVANSSMSQVKVIGGFPDTWTSTSLSGAAIWVMAQSKWRAWNSAVTSYNPATKTVRFNENTQSWYVLYMDPGKTSHNAYGPSIFFLSGARGLLDAEGEWWFDETNNEVLIIPPAGVDPSLSSVELEAKSRDYGFDLDNRSYIHIQDIDFYGTSISMDESNYCMLGGLYFYEFDYREGAVSNRFYIAEGVKISGQGNVIRDCEFNRCSDAGVTILGRNNMLINCYLHEVDYSGYDGGPINLGGHEHLVSHNTVEKTARKGISPDGLGHLIQYNFVKEIGLVTRDQAAIYSGGFDAGNTVIRNNWVNVSNGNPQSLAGGIYMDNWHQNVIVHHNIIWNTDNGLIINRPGNYDVWAHNTVEGNIRTSYGPWIGMESLHGAFIHNNWSTGDIDKNNFCWSKKNNLKTLKSQLNLSFSSEFPLANSNTGGVDAATFMPGINDRFVGDRPDIGALENGELNWSAGHDFNKSPNPVYEPASFYYRNYITNGGFDYSRVNISPKYSLLYMWTRTGIKESAVNYYSGYNYPAADQRNSIYANSIVLKGDADDGIKQEIINLPAGHFVFSAYVRLVDAANPGADVYLSIRMDDKEIAGTWASDVTLIGSQKWRMVKLPFRNLEAGDITVSITKLSDGEAYIDNIGLVPEYRDNPTDFSIDSNTKTIKVQNGKTKEVIPNCTIILNGQNYVTDENGSLTLTEITLDNYELVIEKEGFEPYSINAIDFHTANSFVFNLYPIKYNLTIEIVDIATKQGIYPAKMIINGSLVYYSNKDGIDFQALSGEQYSYVIEYDNYHMEEGSFVASSDSTVTIELTPKIANIIFRIEHDGNTLPGATVTFNGGDYKATTGVVGIYHPTRLTYDFAINKNAYDEITGSIYLEKDTTITVELYATIIPPSATITFNIENEGELLSGATLIFEGAEYNVDTGIISLFTPTLQTYNYSINKDGFDEISGSIYLEKDTTLTIDIIASSLAYINSLNRLIAYPNPATNILKIILPAELINSAIKILSIKGEVLLVQEIDSIYYEIDISELNKGSYVIKIGNDEMNRSIKFIKADR
jgi:hypothetical protein